MDKLFEELTIYHQNEDKQWVRYHTSGSVRNTSIRNRTTTGVSDVDNALIRLFDVEGYNNTYFIKKGDVIVKGHINLGVGNAPISQLRAIYGDDKVYQVKSIDEFIFKDQSIRELQHIKVGAI